MENNLEFICNMFSVLAEKLDKELTKVAENNPVKIDCEDAINSNYFVTYMGEDVAVYGMRINDSDVYADVIYVNGKNAHICITLRLDVFSIEDKERIASYVDDIIKNKTNMASLKQIMSYHNAHNKELVDKINWIANDPVRKPLFDKIVKFLMDSYSDEYNDEYDNDNEDHYYFLTNICDDADLETIISHCRINSMLPNDDKRFKNCDEVVNHFSKPFPTND